MENLPALTGDFSIKDRATKNASNKIFKSLFNKVLLPKLEILELSNLNRLISLIWEDQLLHDSFNNLKTLTVENCGFVKLVPLHVLKSLNNLEELDVKDCDMLEIVFDLQDLNDYYKEMDSPSAVVPLKKLKLWNLPKLKNVWSDHYQGNVSFPSLRSVGVYHCESLTSIFPVSIAKGMLGDLEELGIDFCGVDVIVAKDQVSESVAVTFGFPRLTSLRLSGLRHLRNFYPQKHILEWPHLKELSIQCCDELEIFEKEALGSSEIYEEENMLDSKYPLLTHDKVVGNLERLTLQGKEVEKIGSVQFLMYLFPKLKKLHLSFHEQPSYTLWRSSPNLGELKLSGDFENALRGDNVAALTARFPQLTLENVSIMGSLSPSLVSSPNLTHLNVEQYDGTTLMTSSIAQSLVHITHLSISHCSQIEEIIIKREDKDKEICFRKLEFLELDNLPRLRRFCRYNYTFKFPLLDELVIRSCPKFKRFSPGLIEASSLKSVQLGKDWKKHNEIWDTDLNKIVYRQRYIHETSTALVLDEEDAVMIRNDQFPAGCCPQVEFLQIEGFVEEWITFPYTLLERFPKLNELHVKNSSFEEIFPSHTPSSTSFHNLTMLKVSKCHQLVYILTTSTTKSFVNLETLEIDDCEKLEEIVRNDADEDVGGGITFNGLRILKLNHLPRLETQEDKRDFNIEDRATNTRCTNIPRSLSSHNMVLLPKLEKLELFNLKSLIPLIWDYKLLHNSFNNLKTLTVEKCGFVKLVPLHVMKSLNNLEELEVKDCDMLEIVFDFDDLNDYYKEMDSSSVVVPLKKLKLWNLPKLKNVWSDHYQGNVSFPSLRSVDVYNCKSLTSIFPAFIAKNMLCVLEELKICQCGVDVMVTKGQVSESVAVTFGFPRLTSLWLSSLPNLRNFYPQKHTLECPHLNKLSIQGCDELEIFEKEVSGSSKIYEEENMLDSKYPLLSNDKVVGNLERLALQGKEVEKIGSVQFLMYLFPKLKQLHLSFKKETSFTFWERSPNLGELMLSGDFEKALGGDNVAALTARFPQLTLENVSIMGSLSPSLVSSPNLTHLNVKWCFRTTLMTSSVAQSLVHITHLSISKCHRIEEIISKQEGEHDQDKEISFRKLEYLKLTDLPRLRRFCRHNYTFRFSLLDKLVIARCPKFKRFSPGFIDTPSLKSVQLSQGWQQHHEIWDTNLNKTLYHQRFTGSREVVLEEDDAIMIRNDQFLADCCRQAEILRIKRFVEEWATFPYTLLEIFPKLNELHVKKSSFREIFPSHAPSSTSFLNLTVLKVSKCHQLVYLVTCSTVKILVNLEILEIDECEKMEEIVRNETKEDVEEGITLFNIEGRAPSSTSFHNLAVLKVSKCHQFVYLMTMSTAKSLMNLETLKIDDCEKMEEIIKKELKEDVEEAITLFSGLRILKLSRVPKLKTQEDKKDFNIEDRATNTGCTNISRSLFSHNKVLLPKLERLELSYLLNNLISLIWDDQFLPNSFSNLKTLIVQNCDFKKLVPLRMLKSLNNLEKLEVSYCHKLEMVFGFEDLNDYHKEMESSTVVVPLSLRHLEVNGCRGLTTLMMSSAAPSLAHLAHLSINHCSQIEEVIMKQGGEDDEDREIIFNQMKFLEFDNLPRLKRFCGYNYTFRFPLLKHVTITKCPRLTMFCPGAIHAPRLQRVQVDKAKPNTHIWMKDLNNTIQHLFTFEEVISTTQSMAINGKNITRIVDVFPNVYSLYVESFTDEGVTFPHSSLGKFPKLNGLHVEHCSFEEIFPSHDQIIDFKGKISSSASFQNLWRLSISGCHQLIHLVTTSTAKSLVSLRCLEINDCKRMEEIVMNDTNEDVQDGITFNRLWEIKLTDMPSLKMFSPQSHTFEFPELKEIEISGCPKMKKFCAGVLKTPKLSKVKIEEHGMEWKDEEDLNKTMEGLSSTKDSIIEG